MTIPLPRRGRRDRAVDGPSPPDLAVLPGVPAAVEAARTALTSLRGHPALRRHRERIAGAAAVRAARASAALDGAPLTLRRRTGAGAAPDGSGAGTGADAVGDPRLAGALRATASLVDLIPVWQRAPLQALARLHVLAAADLAGPEPAGAEMLGRPRPDRATGPRLAALADVVIAAPWPAPVMAAVVHGELLALQPFGSADGVVARAAGRLAMMSSGLDPDGLAVPEVAYLRSGPRYRLAAQEFGAGEAGGVTAWLLLVCDALIAGAIQGGSIADTAG